VERLTALKKQFPKAKIVGHRDLSPDKDKDGVVERHEWVKMCPSFDAKSAYSKIK
jgi:N-acetyl-anhydromuramyl-L-alanine amidase AmpD